MQTNLHTYVQPTCLKSWPTLAMRLTVWLIQCKTGSLPVLNQVLGNSFTTFPRDSALLITPNLHKDLSKADMT